PAPVDGPNVQAGSPGPRPDEPSLLVSAPAPPMQAAQADWAVPAASVAPRVAHPERVADTAEPPIPACLPTIVNAPFPVLLRSASPAGSRGAPDQAADGRKTSLRPVPLRSPRRRISAQTLH